MAYLQSIRLLITPHNSFSNWRKGSNSYQTAKSGAAYSHAVSRARGKAAAYLYEGCPFPFACAHAYFSHHFRSFVLIPKSRRYPDGNAYALSWANYFSKLVRWLRSHRCHRPGTTTKRTNMIPCAPAVIVIGFTLRHGTMHTTSSKSILS